MSLFAELKRRNVFRVGIAYLLGAWVLLQAADFGLQVIDAPNWILQVLVLIAGIGLPAVLIFAWVFEMTPEGLKRETEIDRSQSITQVTGRKLDRAIIGILAAAVAFLLYQQFTRPERGSELELGSELGSDPIPEVIGSDPNSGANPGAGATNERSVAVLPFVNMSDDEQNEYFSDGISEELLNVLVGIQGLRVPSRTSSFTFKGSGLKVSEIGRELGVDHVLEGSVRKAGNRIRVTAQLIDVDSDTHLWSDTFTRELDDIFAVQDEIAHAIVGALKVTLSGDDERMLDTRPTENVEAYNKFLLGRHLWNQRASESLLAAVQPLREAVALDPGFGAAWAALADAYVLIPEYRVGPIQEYVPLAKEAIARALAIDPHSARALTTRGYVKTMYDYDLEGAEADFLRAIELMPDYATAHQWYGELLAIRRQFDEALAQFKIGAALDPLAPIMWHVAGWITYQAGHPQEALQYYDKVFSINPHFEPTLGNLITAHAMLGNFDEAREYARRVREMRYEDDSAALALIDAMEDPALKERFFRTMENSDMEDGVLRKAFYYQLLGEQELALQNLLSAFETGDPYAVHVNRIAVYDSLRDDPRFQAHLARMNLWP